MKANPWLLRIRDKVLYPLLTAAEANFKLMSVFNNGVEHISAQLPE